jgi:hypothetical protein
MRPDLTQADVLIGRQRKADTQFPAIDTSARMPTTRPAPSATPLIAEMIGLLQLMTL